MDIKTNTEGNRNILTLPSARWGEAPQSVKDEAIQSIRDNSSDLSQEDQAILLATAELESGFNPNAQASTTSAAGIFQITKGTAKGLGLAEAERYNLNKNIKAGIALFKQNLRLLNKKFPDLVGDARALKLYALHHDGPGLNSGGEEIGRAQLLPRLGKYRESVGADLVQRTSSNVLRLRNA